MHYQNVPPQNYNSYPTAYQVVSRFFFGFEACRTFCGSRVSLVLSIVINIHLEAVKQTLDLDLIQNVSISDLHGLASEEYQELEQLTNIC